MEIEKALASATKRAEATQVAHYEASMPQKDLIVLQAGDEFTILPGIYNIPIGRKRAGVADTRAKYQANYATLVRGGVEIGVVPVSPSVFSRSAQPCEVDADGKFTGVKNAPRISSKGQPCDDFFEKDSLDEAMGALVGKKIRVTSVTHEYSYDERFMPNGKAQKRAYYVLEYVTA
jgi:hypothetical protein